MPESAATATRKPIVFISYSRENTVTRRVVAIALDNAHYDPWFDEQEIIPSARVHDRISEGLMEADCVVFIATHHSITSPEVFDEIVRADERRIPIISLYGSDVELQ